MIVNYCQEKPVREVKKKNDKNNKIEKRRMIFLEIFIFFNGSKF